MKLLKNGKKRYSVIKKLYELRTKEEKRKEKVIYLAFVISFIPMFVIVLTFKVMMISELYFGISAIPPIVCLFYKEYWDDRLLDMLKKRSTDLFWKEHDRWNLKVKITTGEINEGMSNNFIKAHEDFLKKYNENLK